MSIMMSILEVFTETEWVPEPGKYYTFLYIAKSPDITYDEQPLHKRIKLINNDKKI